MVLQVITILNMAARECRSFLSRYRSSRSATWWQWPWIVWMWSSEMRTTRTSEHSWISSNFIQVSHKLGTNFITASVAGEWASTSPQIGSEQLREVQLTGRQSQSLSQSAVGVNFSTSLIGKMRQLQGKVGHRETKIHAVAVKGPRKFSSCACLISMISHHESTHKLQEWITARLSKFLQIRLCYGC